MALFFQELKKIWRPGILVALALLGGIYYNMFPLFYIEYFFNANTAEVEYDLAVEWLEKYGPTMEPEEREELDEQLSDEIQAFNEQLAAFPEAVRRGLDDYASFQAGYSSYWGSIENGQEKDADIERFFDTVRNSTLYYRVKKLENYIANYDWHSDVAENWEGFYSNEPDDAWGPGKKARQQELDCGGSRGFLPLGVLSSTSEYAKDLAVWIVLSVVVLLSPSLVRDRLHRMRQTQWSSRQGRRVQSVQLAAGMASALALTALDAAIYAVPFLAQGPLKLARCPLYNWCKGGYPWFDWTYGGYLGVLLLLLLALGVGAGALTMFLSQYSGNYIAMLLKAVPLFVVLGPLFGSWLLDGAFFFRVLYDYSNIDVPKGAEGVCAAALVALGAALLLWTALRQKRRELVS